MASESWQLRCAELKQRGAYLFKSKLWSDCTFQVDNVTVKAHKLIMAMASPVFAKLLFGSFVKSPLAIEDVRPEVFDILLEYIYSDNLNISSPKDACDLYYAAKRWRLLFVCKQCVHYLSEHMSPENVSHIYQVACESGDTMLQKTCEKIFSTKTKEILKDGSFYDLHPRTVVRLFSLDPLNIDSELDLFDAAVNYATANNKRKHTSNYGETTIHNDGPSPPKQACFEPETAQQSQLSNGSAMDLEESQSDRNESFHESQLNSPAPVRECEGKHKYRDLLCPIRFLTLAPQEFAECASLSRMLSRSDMLALSMNIASRETKMSVPEGFSTSMVPRTHSTRMERTRLSAVFRSIIHNFRTVRKHESRAFYVRNLAWTLMLLAAGQDKLVLAVTCFFEAGPPEWVRSTKVKVKFCTHKPVPRHLHKISLTVSDPTPEYGAWVGQVDRSDVLNHEYAFVDDFNTLTYKLYINTVPRPGASPDADELATNIHTDSLETLGLRSQKTTPTPEHKQERSGGNTPLSSRTDTHPQSRSINPDLTINPPNDSSVTPAGHAITSLRSSTEIISKPLSSEPVVTNPYTEDNSSIVSDASRLSTDSASTLTTYNVRTPESQPRPALVVPTTASGPRSTSTVTTAAALTVSTPTSTVKTPASTVTTPTSTVKTPASTVTTPAATVITPASTVTTPAATVTTPAPQPQLASPVTTTATVKAAVSQSQPISTVTSPSSQPQLTSSVTSSVSQQRPIPTVTTATSQVRPISTVTTPASQQRPVLTATTPLTQPRPVSTVTSLASQPLPVSTVTSPASLPRSVSTVTSPAPLPRAVSTITSPASQPRPVSTVTSPASLPRPISTVTSPASLPRPVSNVTSPASLPRPVSTVTSPASQPRPVSTVTSPASLPRPVSTFTSPASLPRPLSTVTSPASQPRPVSNVTSPASLPRPVSSVTSPASLPRSISTVTSPASLPRPVSTVTSPASLPRPLSTVTSPASLPRPLSTVTSPASLSRPVSTVTSPASLPRPVSSVTSPTSLPRPVSSVTSPASQPRPVSTVTCPAPLPRPVSAVISPVSLPRPVSAVISPVSLPRPVSTVTSPASLPRPLSTVTSPALQLRTVSTVTSPASLPRPVSTVTSPASLPRPLSPVTSPASQLRTVSTVTSPALQLRTVSTVTSPASLPRPVSTVTSPASLPRPLSPVTSPASQLRTVSTVTSPASLPRPVSSVTSPASQPRPVSTVTCPAPLPRPVSTVISPASQLRPTPTFTTAASQPRPNSPIKTLNTLPRPMSALSTPPKPCLPSSRSISTALTTTLQSRPILNISTAATPSRHIINTFASQSRLLQATQIQAPTTMRVLPTPRTTMPGSNVTTSPRFPSTVSTLPTSYKSHSSADAPTIGSSLTSVLPQTRSIASTLTQSVSPLTNATQLSSSNVPTLGRTGADPTTTQLKSAHTDFIRTWQSSAVSSLPSAQIRTAMWHSRPPHDLRQIHHSTGRTSNSSGNSPSPAYSFICLRPHVQTQGSSTCQLRPPLSTFQLSPHNVALWQAELHARTLADPRLQIQTPERPPLHDQSRQSQHTPDTFPERLTNALISRYGRILSVPRHLIVVCIGSIRRPVLECFRRPPVTPNVIKARLTQVLRVHPELRRFPPEVIRSIIDTIRRSDGTAVVHLQSPQPVSAPTSTLHRLESSSVTPNHDPQLNLQSKSSELSSQKPTSTVTALQATPTPQPASLTSGLTTQSPIDKPSETPPSTPTDMPTAPKFSPMSVASKKSFSTVTAPQSRPTPQPASLTSGLTTSSPIDKLSETPPSTPTDMPIAPKFSPISVASKKPVSTVTAPQSTPTPQPASFTSGLTTQSPIDKPSEMPPSIPTDMPIAPKFSPMSVASKKSVSTVTAPQSRPTPQPASLTSGLTTSSPIDKLSETPPSTPTDMPIAPKFSLISVASKKPVSTVTAPQSTPTPQPASFTSGLTTQSPIDKPSETPPSIPTDMPIAPKFSPMSVASKKSVSTVTAPQPASLTSGLTTPLPIDKPLETPPSTPTDMPTASKFSPMSVASKKSVSTVTAPQSTPTPQPASLTSGLTTPLPIDKPTETPSSIPTNMPTAPKSSPMSVASTHLSPIKSSVPPTDTSIQKPFKEKSSGLTQESPNIFTPVIPADLTSYPIQAVTIPWPTNCTNTSTITSNAPLTDTSIGKPSKETQENSKIATPMILEQSTSYPIQAVTLPWPTKSTNTSFITTSAPPTDTSIQEKSSEVMQQNPKISTPKTTAQPTPYPIHAVTLPWPTKCTNASTITTSEPLTDTSIKESLKEDISGFTQENLKLSTPVTTAQPTSYRIHAVTLPWPTKCTNTNTTSSNKSKQAIPNESSVTVSSSTLSKRNISTQNKLNSDSETFELPSQTALLTVVKKSSTEPTQEKEISCIEVKTKMPQPESLKTKCISALAKSILQSDSKIEESFVQNNFKVFQPNLLIDIALSEVVRTTLARKHLETLEKDLNSLFSTKSPNTDVTLNMPEAGTIPSQAARANEDILTGEISPPTLLEITLKLTINIINTAGNKSLPKDNSEAEDTTSNVLAIKQLPSLKQLVLSELHHAGL